MIALAFLHLAVIAQSFPGMLADDFDRIEGKTLAALATGSNVEPRESLSLEELAALPAPLQGIRGAVLLVKTDQGNLARVQAASGFRSRSPGSDDQKQEQLLPIFVLERFATFEAGAFTKRLAKGRDLILFPSFEFDLDSGLVVPPGQGGDLRLTEIVGGNPRLVATTGASISVLTSAPSLPDQLPGEPSPGRAVIATDYTGRYVLYTDGASSGRLDLLVEGKTVSGQFRSEQSGSAYPVRGAVGNEPVPRIRFSIAYPMTQDEYEGVLFTSGKGVIAGGVNQLDRQHAFFAVRKGGKVAPDADESTQEPNP